MDIIFLAIVALWLIFKLFSIIGQDLDGNTEAFKGMAAKEPAKEETEAESAQETVIDVTPTVQSAKVTGIVKKIKAIDSDFDENQFLQGTIFCFKTVLEAFSNGDKKSLKDLLLPKIYKVFAAEIDTRADRKYHAVKQVVSIIESRIDAVNCKATTIEVAVCFVSDQIDVLYDGQNRVISGHPKDIVRLKDRWVFNRSLKSKKSNWYLKDTG